MAPFTWGAVCISQPTTGSQVAAWHSPGRKVVMLMAQQLKFPFPVPEGHEVRFTASITLKNGRVIYAKHYGIKAFPILVKTKH